MVISFLNALIDIYDTLEIARSNPIKGFVQGAKLFVYIVGGIFLVSALLGRDPWGLVAGIGAVTAVLLLVFTFTATAIFHRYWQINNPIQRNYHMLLGLANVGLTGGLLLIF